MSIQRVDESQVTAAPTPRSTCACGRPLARRTDPATPAQAEWRPCIVCDGLLSRLVYAPIAA